MPAMGLMRMILTIEAKDGNGLETNEINGGG
jgi:hypothetical protein